MTPEELIEWEAGVRIRTKEAQAVDDAKAESARRERKALRRVAKQLLAKAQVQQYPWERAERVGRVILALIECSEPLGGNHDV